MQLLVDNLDQTPYYPNRIDRLDELADRFEDVYILDHDEKRVKYPEAKVVQRTGRHKLGLDAQDCVKNE